MAYVKLGVTNEDLAYYVLTILALMTPGTKSVDEKAVTAQSETQGGLMQLHVAGKGVWHQKEPHQRYTCAWGTNGDGSTGGGHAGAEANMPLLPPHRITKSFSLE